MSKYDALLLILLSKDPKFDDTLKTTISKVTAPKNMQGVVEEVCNIFHNLCKELSEPASQRYQKACGRILKSLSSVELNQMQGSVDRLSSQKPQAHWFTTLFVDKEFFESLNVCQKHKQDQAQNGDADTMVFRYMRACLLLYLLILYILHSNDLMETTFRCLFDDICKLFSVVFDSSFAISCPETERKRSRTRVESRREVKKAREELESKTDAMACPICTDSLALQANVHMKCCNATVHVECIRRWRMIGITPMSAARTADDDKVPDTSTCPFCKRRSDNKCTSSRRILASNE